MTYNSDKTLHLYGGASTDKRLAILVDEDLTQAEIDYLNDLFGVDKWVAVRSVDTVNTIYDMTLNIDTVFYLYRSKPYRTKLSLFNYDEDTRVNLTVETEYTRKVVPERLTEILGDKYVGHVFMRDMNSSLDTFIHMTKYMYRVYSSTLVLSSPNIKRLYNPVTGVYNDIYAINNDVLTFKHEVDLNINNIYHLMDENNNEIASVKFGLFSDGDMVKVQDYTSVSDDRARNLRLISDDERFIVKVNRALSNVEKGKLNTLFGRNMWIGEVI